MKRSQRTILRLEAEVWLRDLNGLCEAARVAGLDQDELVAVCVVDGLQAGQEWLMKMLSQRPEG